MRCKDHMIMELFTDDPDWENGIFQVFTDLNILEGFKNGQKTKLRLLIDAFDLIVINKFITVEAIRRSSSCQ